MGNPAGSIAKNCLNVLHRIIIDRKERVEIKAAKEEARS